VKKGWVVVFAWRGQILTHRVIKTRNHEFWARGDACTDAEGPVPVDRVIGRVEGYWRDGRWRDLSGLHRGILGLAYNEISSRARRLTRQWPGLRRIVELDLYKKIGGWIYGDISTQEDNRVERVLGALVSDAIPLTQRLVADVEGHLAKGDLNLIVARSLRAGRVGHILLSRVESDTGCLTSLQVSLGARGLGVDLMLIEAAEASARGRGWKKLLAPLAPDDLHRSDVYSSAGYRPVDGMYSKSLGKA
jgi:GNAT superfamily N-acetyltransferase